MIWLRTGSGRRFLSHSARNLKSRRLWSFYATEIKSDHHKSRPDVARAVMVMTCDWPVHDNVSEKRTVSFFRAEVSSEPNTFLLETANRAEV